MAKSDKITALVAALDARFQSVANLVTSWGGTPSDSKYPSEKLVKSSLDNKEDSANKVTSFAATVSLSDEKYPSEKLVKTALDLKEDASNKVTTFASTLNLSDEKYPSEKLVKTELDKKLDATSVPTKTSDLTNDGDGTNAFLTAHQSLSDAEGIVDVEKQTTPETGYAATYVIKQGSSSSKSQVGVKINIPKDFLVKSGEVKTAASADLTTLGSGYQVGDKYIDFVINTKEDDGTDEHMYINVKDLVEDTTYTADGTTLTLSNGQFSITTGGVDTTQIADSAVTTAKIADSNVTTAKIADSNVTTAKIANGAVTSDKIASALSSTWLTTSDVDSEIEDYIDALTTALTPAAQQQAGE